MKIEPPGVPVFFPFLLFKDLVFSKGWLGFSTLSWRLA
jgi:hypothetical protein